MRTWIRDREDDGSVHAIGNGEMLVYGQGIDIMHVFGPPYSAPSFFRLDLRREDDMTAITSERERHTAIWTHRVHADDRVLASVTDFMMPDRNLFCREIETEGTLRFRLAPGSEVNAFLRKGYGTSSGKAVDMLHLSIPKGSTFFFRNPVPEETSLLAAVVGDAVLAADPDGTLRLDCLPGRTRMFFCGHGAHPEAVRLLEDTLSNPEEDRIGPCRRFWQAFSRRRHDFASMIPEGHPLGARMQDAIDSVSVLMKCQQSTSGGVAAGHFYNMAYVRDMSGVLRGFLALGYLPEARAILEFWIRKHAAFGNLSNAEGMGNDSARLVFTNDEVEGPAYLVLLVFHYYERTRDLDLVRRAFPMMAWAFEIQLGHLAAGMTEFSGDETYIAGGALTGACMYQGSAESTLLFIESGRRLLQWAEAQAQWDPAKIGRYRQVVADAESRYRHNFVADGRLLANNPLREQVAGAPRFRFSFCMAHEPGQPTPPMTWTERRPDGSYVCADCAGKASRAPAAPAAGVVLNSVSFMPAFVGCSFLSRDEMAGFIEPGVQAFLETGRMPSCLSGRRSLGYDYGLLLHNLVFFGHPAREKAVVAMLDLLDPTGSWVEYYDGDKPFNCRCRPWESGINIEALAGYIRSLS